MTTESSTTAEDNAQSVLVVDDDAGLLKVLEMGLKKLGYRVNCASNIASGLDALDASPPSVILTDLDIGGESGLDLADRVRGKRPDIPILMMTGHGSVDSAVEAIRVGIADFITKPVDLPFLNLRLRRALEHKALADEVKRLKEVDLAPKTSQILGASKAIERVRDMAQRVAQSTAPVLVTGQSGTGKELVAREVHHHSPRRDGPFVAVNCAALPESLVESELFGHAKGAFTDAKTAKAGLFCEADGGTLFLDEVGELPLEVQAKLLRALQEQRVRPVGGAEEVSFDARVVAATNVDLEEAMREGNFREDLYYRLCVVEIVSPPLNARGNDILLLAQHFLRQEAEASGRTIEGLLPKVAQCLLDYDWPGNVRELQNCMRRAVALAQHDHITVDDLPERIASHEPVRAEVPESTDPSQFLTMAEVEARYIQRVLKAVGGNKSQAARVLGFARRKLYRKLEQIENGSTDAERDDGDNETES